MEEESKKIYNEGYSFGVLTASFFCLVIIIGISIIKSFN
jgi:hypothetical protein